MADAKDLNPFSAPQASGFHPSTADVHPEAEILQAVASELSKTKYGFWAVTIAAFCIAGFTLWQLFFVLMVIGHLPSALFNLLGVTLYAVAGILAWRITARIKEFNWNPKPFSMNEVFTAHAGFWKFIGIIAVIAVVLIIPLAFLSVLFVV